MAEQKPVESYRNRRLHKRFALVDDKAPAPMSFRYPSEGGRVFQTRVKDISLSGISMVLPDELPGLKVGDILPNIEANVAGQAFRIDLLVMHMTPGNQVGAACGGLIYPERDEDIITIRRIIRSLDGTIRRDNPLIG
jgi:hypothetical protein